MKKLTEVKDDLLDLLESLPHIIWYVGCFIVGFIVGAW